MGTWIEIPKTLWLLQNARRRSLQWERGLKFNRQMNYPDHAQSFPAMGTWIEIHLKTRKSAEWLVVPCNGNVDWNYSEIFANIFKRCRSLQWERGLKCALSHSICTCLCRSLQWERGLKCKHCKRRSGRKGRSLQWERGVKYEELEEWIAENSRCLLWDRGLKCCSVVSVSRHLSVVPCNGNVDWNIFCPTHIIFSFRRSLQWERGLKFVYLLYGCGLRRSFPAMGTWIEIPNIICCAHNIASRSLQWERGLKYNIH